MVPMRPTQFCISLLVYIGREEVSVQVKVLYNIGDACIRKLHELHMHVDKSKNGMVVVPEGCGEVRTVAQMAALMAANRNSHMGEKRLYQGILNMNEVSPALRGVVSSCRQNSTFDSKPQ